jgi:hypothetical protein
MLVGDIMKRVTERQENGIPKTMMYAYKIVA